MLSDNTRLSCAVDQHMGILDHTAVVEREYVFDQQAVVEQEEERRQDGDQDDGIRDGVRCSVQIEQHIHTVDQDQADDQRVEDANAILYPRIPHNTAIAARNEDRDQTTDDIDGNTQRKLMGNNFRDVEIKAEEVAEGCGKGNNAQVDEHNNPTGQDLKSVNRPNQVVGAGNTLNHGRRLAD